MRDPKGELLNGEKGGFFIAENKCVQSERTAFRKHIETKNEELTRKKHRGLLCCIRDGLYYIQPYQLNFGDPDFFARDRETRGRTEKSGGKADAIGMKIRRKGDARRFPCAKAGGVCGITPFGL